MNAADTLTLPPSSPLPRVLEIERSRQKNRTRYAVAVRVPGCAEMLVWQYACTLRLTLPISETRYSLWAENEVGEGPSFAVTATEAQQIADWAGIPLPAPIPPPPEAT